MLNAIVLMFKLVTLINFCVMIALTYRNSDGKYAKLWLTNH